ncbi:MAG: dTDP-glucose 4,6-dehydratase [Gemmatimonadota bacterium]
MNRTILVTGGAGFIGSALVRHLIRHTSARVVNVDSLTYAGTLGSLADVVDSPRYVWERVDIRDRPALKDVFDRHGPNAVFHLAAESHVDRSIDGPAAFVDTNLVGTFNLLQAAREAWSADAGHARLQNKNAAHPFRFIHVSTDEVFGSLGETGAFTADSPYRPNSPYAASKAGADHLARAWYHTYGFPVIVTNCSNNFGPYQFPEKLIPHMILCAIEGRDLPVYGKGANVRDWIFVEDHVRGLVRALEAGRPGMAYLFGGDAQRRNLDVVRAICELLDGMSPAPDGRGHRERIRFVADRPGHDERYAIDATDTREELGWSPEGTFEEHLRTTVAWYVSREDWWGPIRSGAYRGERLGMLR